MSHVDFSDECTSRHVRTADQALSLSFPCTTFVIFVDRFVRPCRRHTLVGTDVLSQLLRCHTRCDCVTLYHLLQRDTTINNQVSALLFTLTSIKRDGWNRLPLSRGSVMEASSWRSWRKLRNQFWKSDSLLIPITKSFWDLMMTEWIPYTNFGEKPEQQFTFR